MSSTITVAGGSGTTQTVTLTTSSSVAFNIANMIGFAITSFVTTTGAIATQITASDTSTTIPTTTGATQVIDTASGPTTIDAKTLSPTSFFNVVAEDGGTTFLSGSPNGGDLYFDGGTNFVADPIVYNFNAIDSTTGGLTGGPWRLTFGGATNTALFASGNDSIFSASNTSANKIATGAATVVVTSHSHDTVNVGIGSVTYSGTDGSGQFIYGAGHAGGTDVLAGGTGGGATITAAAGNTTLAGFSTVSGKGDFLYADTTGSSHQTLWATGNASLYGGGAGNDSFFGFTAINGTLYNQGNVAMSAQNATGTNAFWVGGGSDTIWAGTGSDSIFFDPTYTAHSGNQATTDLIFNYTANDTLFLGNYSSSVIGSSSSTGSPGSVTVTLSDNTTIVFQGLTDPTKLNVKLGPTG